MSAPSQKSSTERRFLHSTAAAYGSQFGRTLLRLASDLALARLVLPDEHGLFALAWSTVIIAGFVRDFGLPYELVRNEKEPYGSVLLWEVLAGTIVTVGLIAGAGAFAGLDPRLPEVLRVLAFFVLLEGLSVVPRVFFERNLRVTQLVVPEIARSFVMASVSIGLALAGFGVWSLIAGELVAMFCYAGFLWLRARAEIPLVFNWSLVPDLLRRSSLLFLIALLGNTMPFIGRYVVKFRESTEMVGQYEKALLWSLRAQILIVPALVRALYPALVAYVNDRPRLVSAYRLGTVAILAVEVLVAYFLYFNTEIVILEIVLGRNWLPAVGLVKILCFLPLVDPFSRLGGELLKVLRKDRIWLAVVIANFACLLGFGLLLSNGLGTRGMAWAHYLLLGNLLMAWRVWKICGPEFFRLTRDLLFIYLLPLPFFWALTVVFPAETWPRFFASLAVVALAGAIYLKRFAGPFRTFFRSDLGGDGLTDGAPPVP